MATIPSSYLVILTISIALLVLSSAVDATKNHQFGWIPTHSTPSGSSSSCTGSISECLTETEFEMDSEISRRILATNQYISYGALRRDTTPCSRRGASYYNCKPGAQANPYSRGCSAITRCRS